MNKQKELIIWFIKPHYWIYYFPHSGVVKIRSSSSIKLGREITQRVDQNGYLVSKINNKTKHVHTIVGDKFFGKKQGYCVNHIDSNKLNNKIDNLEYITISENVKHAVASGKHISSRPNDSGRYKHGRAIKSNLKQYKKDWYNDKKYEQKQ